MPVGMDISAKASAVDVQRSPLMDGLDELQKRVSETDQTIELLVHKLRPLCRDEDGGESEPSSPNPAASTAVTEINILKERMSRQATQIRALINRLDV